MNAVPVSTPMLADVDDAAKVQITNDFLHGALGNSHALGNVAQPRLGITRQDQQYVAVITE